MDGVTITATLRRHIIGQDAALAELDRALLFAQAGMTEPDKPLAVLLFLGPTGVGKTETVKALATAIHGSADRCCRVDMGALAEHHYAASLAGAPPGYIGSDEGATLLDKALIEGVPGKPGILLLDEVEKAHPVVRQTLLQIFDNARLRLSNAREEIAFSNTLIVMTSNVGSEALRQVARVHDDAARERVVGAAMEAAFPPEFLNRIDAVVVFRWLERDDLARIVDLQVERLNDSLAAHHGVQVQLDDAARRLLARVGLDARYGARHLKRILRQRLYEPLARLLVAEATPTGGIVTVTAEDARLALELHHAAAMIHTRRPDGPALRAPDPWSGVALYPYPVSPGGRGAALATPQAADASRS